MGHCVQLPCKLSLLSEKLFPHPPIQRHYRFWFVFWIVNGYLKLTFVIWAEFLSLMQIGEYMSLPSCKVNLIVRVWKQECFSLTVACISIIKWSTILHSVDPWGYLYIESAWLVNTWSRSSNVYVFPVLTVLSVPRCRLNLEFSLLANFRVSLNSVRFCFYHSQFSGVEQMSLTWFSDL